MYKNIPEALNQFIKISKDPSMVTTGSTGA